MSRFQHTYYSKTSRQSSTPEAPMGPIIESRRSGRYEATASSTPTLRAKIEHVESIASYNWLDKDNGMILVPGQPPRWAPSRGDIKLQEDSGRYFRDKNAARSPKHPFAPAIAACLATSPASLDNVDIVACGSTIGNLLRFVRNEPKKCRMPVEKVGGAVFLIRRENSPTETIPDVRGFGHSFPEACTEWVPEVRNSVSHQRIIKYRFGGLNLLVRFEADGYIDASGKGLAGGPVYGDKSASKSPAQVDDIVQAFSTATVSPATEKPPVKLATPAETLKLKIAGRIVSQSRLFDLKTRSIRKADVDHLQEELPRLWVAQIPKFVLAFHSHGLFRKENISVKNVTEAVKSWEAKHQDELAKLASLLQHIVKLSSSTTAKNGRLEVTINESGVLDFRQQLGDAGEALPRELKVKWERHCTHGAPDCKSEAESEKGGSSKKKLGVSVLKWEEPGQNLTGCSEGCNYCGRCG